MEILKTLNIIFRTYSNLPLWQFLKQAHRVLIFKQILTGFSHSKRILTGFWYSKRILTGFPIVKSYLIKRKPKYNFNKSLSENNFQIFY